MRRLKFENNWSGNKQITTVYQCDPCPEHPDFLQAPTVMSSVPPKSNTSVPVAPEPPVSSQPSQGSSEGPNQRNPHSRGNKKATAKTVTLADAVQKTVVLSHKVLRVDVNREHGQIRKVSETRLKLRLEDLARVPPVGIIKGLLVWPDNCMLLHLLLHVCRLCTGLGTNFCLLLPQWVASGSLVVSMSFVRRGDGPVNVRKRIWTL